MTTATHPTPPPAFFRPPERPPFLDATPGRSVHDFLVLTQRPDLTPEMFPPPNRPARREHFRRA